MQEPNQPLQNQPNNSSTPQNPVGRFMVAVGAIIEDTTTGKILLTQRAPDQDWHPGEWEITYGRIDQFEDTITGLKRELSEEIGLTDITLGDVLTVWHIFRGPELAENELIGITYHCTVTSPQIQLSHEHSQYQWVDPEEALHFVKVDGIRRDIQKYIEYKKGDIHA